MYVFMYVCVRVCVYVCVYVCTHVYISMSTLSDLSLEAFSSNTASFIADPSNALAKHNILVVLPIPGGPYQT